MSAFLSCSLLACITNIFFLISYVSNVNSFKKPLSLKEEQMYLERYKNGDKEAKNILIERNLRLVAHVVKKYSNQNIDTDDLISIGTIGLIKAINTYNFERGRKLSTYAAKCIDNEILMSIRSNKKHQNELMLQEPIGVDKEGNEVTLIDKLGTDDDGIFEEVNLKMQIADLYSAMKEILLDREQSIIQLRYGLCGEKSFTQKEIANMMGISRSYVSRIEKKALKKLLNRFNENETVSDV